MICSICSADTEFFGSATILKNYKAEFRKCVSCGFIFAVNPVWLDEAYSSVISLSDVGLVERNLWFAKVSSSLISVLFNANGRFIDYGGGTGLYTRLMRDAGFDYYWYDSRCQNIFAEDFALNSCDSGQFELLTATELFEHLTDPHQTMSELFGLSPNILFTTLLLPYHPPRLDDWWYYGLEHGQHISFYTRKSLQKIADKYGLRFISNGHNLHLFCKKEFSNIIFKIITSSLFSSLVMQVMKRESLLSADYERVRNRTRGNDANCH